MGKVKSKGYRAKLPLRGAALFENLCNSCMYSKEVVTVEHRPIYASSRLIHDVRVLRIQCGRSFNLVGKVKTWRDAKECGFRPKAGQIRKGLYQCRITDLP